MNENMTATEIQQRWEDWENSSEVKEMAQALSREIIEPLILPLIERALRILAEQQPTTPTERGGEG